MMPLLSSPNLPLTPLTSEPSASDHRSNQSAQSNVFDLSSSPTLPSAPLRRRSASTRASRLDPPATASSSLQRSGSLRSAQLPSPLSDFQSDNVLNAHSAPPYHSPPTIPVWGPVSHASPPPSALALETSGLGRIEKRQSRGEAGSPVWGPVGGHNPFAAPGLQDWTRETWGSRKIALISGITGQGGSIAHL